MQNRISYYITSLLHLHGSVRIPGLGKIAQSKEPAREEMLHDRIAPPQTLSTFVPDKTHRGSLLERYIVYKTNLSRTKVRKELLQYAKQIHIQAGDGATADLGYLGTMVQGSRDLEFRPNETFLNPGHAALTKVPLPPYLKDPEQADQKTVPDAPYELSLPPLVSAWPEHEEGEHHREDLEVPSETIAPDNHPDPDVVHEDIPAVLPATKKAQSPEPPEVVPVAEARRNHRWVIPVAAGVLLLVFLAGFLLLRRDRDHIAETVLRTDRTERQDIILEPVPAESTDQQDNAQIVLADTGSHPVEEEASVSREPQYAPETEPPPAVPPATDSGTAAGSKSCMVVVGAFSLTRNADRMIQRLSALGFETRSVQKGNLAQIGIPADCDASDLDMLVTQVRNAVEPTAWVLRPQ